MRKLKLTSQVIIATVLAAITVGLVFGKLERASETERLQSSLKEQAVLTASLLGGTMLEALIVEDVPLLETAIQQAVDHNPSIAGIALQNEDGIEITRYPTGEFSSGDHYQQFTKNVIFEDEVFGTMVFNWSTLKGQQEIERRVSGVYVSMTTTLASLAIMFLFMLTKLVLVPIQRIKTRMEATIARKNPSNIKLSGYSSQEFAALNRSVTYLENTLTQRDKRELALKLARKNAEQASVAKSEFLATMSHEIRTPMNGVIGMADMLIDTDLDENQRLYADTIAQSGAALLSIINDILDFSKIEAGNIAVDIAPFNLFEVIEEQFTQIASKSGCYLVELSLDYPASLPREYLGDAGHIRQILTNVIGNAKKFTPQGNIIVTVSEQVIDEKNQVIISVSDTGIGIPKEKLAGIFNAFEQVDSAKNRQFEGAGLGLAISNKLIGQLNGALTCQSELGKGSTFTITLPLEPCQNVQDMPPQGIPNTQSAKVLIVDDLAINQKILQERLATWGMSAQTANSAAQAQTILLSAARSGTPFTLALLDCSLPDLTGTELAESIRDHATLDDLNLILLSRQGHLPHSSTKQSLAISETLLKPVPLKALHSAISKTLRPSPTLVSSSPSTTDNKRLNFHVLLVEDNKTNQIVVKSMLKSTGITIAIAGNGKIASEIFEREQPDLILMDISMPVMDGLDATIAIRKQEARMARDRIPIIALTANAIQGDRERCIAAGMDDYLTKPIKKNALIERLDRWHRPCADKKIVYSDKTG